MTKLRFNQGQVLSFDFDAKNHIFVQHRAYISSQEKRALELAGYYISLPYKRHLYTNHKVFTVKSRTIYFILSVTTAVEVKPERRKNTLNKLRQHNYKTIIAHIQGNQDAHGSQSLPVSDTIASKHQTSQKKLELHLHQHQSCHHNQLASYSIKIPAKLEENGRSTAVLSQLDNVKFHVKQKFAAALHDDFSEQVAHNQPNSAVIVLYLKILLTHKHSSNAHHIP